MYEEAQYGQDTMPGAIVALDEQLSHYDKIIDVLRARLDPVLSRYETSEVIQPRAEPQSDLRARAERLREMNARLEMLINQLDI